MNKEKKGFTLVELMIVIAVLAILASIVLFALNPAEVFKKTRDAQRMSDMRTISGAITYYISLGNNVCQSGATGDGTPNIAYLSATPTSGFACGGDSIGGGTGTGTDGTGWVPINFGTDAAVSTLPLDPINTTALTYVYGCEAASTFHLMANMESTNYVNGGNNDKESTDGGANLFAYETGTDLTILSSTCGGWTS